MPLPIIVALISNLANVLVSALGGEGVISGNLAKLINTIVSSGAALFALLKSGGTPADAVLNVLNTLQTDLTAVEQDTSTDPGLLKQIQEAISLTEEAINAYEKAQTVTDPSTLTPIPPVE